MDIYDFQNLKTSKALCFKLAQERIDFYKRNKNVFFDLKWSNYWFQVEAMCDPAGVIFRYVFRFNNVKHTYDSIADGVLEIKKEFESKFENKTLDNTNHLDRSSIYVALGNEEWKVSLRCTDNDIFDKPAIWFEAKNYHHPDKKPFHFWQYVGICLGGGVAFGLCMFAFMAPGSEKTYLETFLICMLGGLGWGVAFAIFYGIPTLINNVRRSKGIEKAKEAEAKQNVINPAAVSGVIYFEKTSHRINRKAYSGEATIENNELVLRACNNKEIPVIRKPAGECLNELNVSLDIMFEDNGIVCYFEPVPFSRERLIAKLEEVCRDKVEGELFDAVKKAIIEFNPYSLYDTQKDNVLDGEIANLIGRLETCEKVDEETVNNLVYNYFFYDEYYQRNLSPIILEAYRQAKAKKDQ